MSPAHLIHSLQKHPRPLVEEDVQLLESGATWHELCDAYLYSTPDTPQPLKDRIRARMAALK